MQKETFDVFYPTCNILVEAKVIVRGFVGYRSDAVNAIDEVDTDGHGNRYSVALCRHCNGPSLVREALYGDHGQFATVTDEAVLYLEVSGPKLEGLPDSIVRSVAQAHRSYSTSSYDACAVMCRRAMEVLCKLCQPMEETWLGASPT